MCDVVKKYNELFREILLGVKEKYIQAYPDESKTLKFYCFDPEEKKLDIFSYDQKVREASDKCLEYYWIEFECGGQEYKISMFFKTFNYGTGNILVLPGAVQFWKKENKGNSYPISDLNLYQVGRIKAYKEYDWCPLIVKPTFWDINNLFSMKNQNYVGNMNAVIYAIWKTFKMKTDLIVYQNGTGQNAIYSNEFYKEILPYFTQILANHNINCNKIISGNYQNYILFKWIDTDTYNMIATHDIFEIENYGYFISFGNIKTYTKHGKHPNEYVNGVWNISYKIYKEVAIQYS